jgi:hypothetical protein
MGVRTAQGGRRNTKLDRKYNAEKGRPDKIGKPNWETVCNKGNR